MSTVPGITSLAPSCAAHPDVRVWAADVPTCTPWAADLGTSATGSVEQPHRQRRSHTRELRSRIVRRTIATWLDVPVDLVTLSSTDSGAPLLLLDSEPGPDISTASTGDVLLIAAGGIGLGVDIESRATAQTTTDVAALLHPREQHVIAEAATALREAVFTQLWVRKEALLKAMRTGLARDLAADDVTSPVTGMCMCDIVIPPAAVPSAHGHHLHAALCIAEAPVRRS